MRRWQGATLQGSAAAVKMLSLLILLPFFMLRIAKVVLTTGNEILGPRMYKHTCKHTRIFKCSSVERGSCRDSDVLDSISTAWCGNTRLLAFIVD